MQRFRHASRGVLSLFLSLSVLAAPGWAAAQLRLEGMDFSDSDEKKKAPARRTAPARKAAPTAPKPKKAAGAKDAASKEGEAKAPAPKGRLGLDLSEDDGPAQPLQIKALDLSAPTEARRLDLAMGVFKERNFEAAALAFHEILQDPQLADQHAEAEYLLAKSLYRLGMYHSALQVFKNILSQGEGNRFHPLSLEWLFFIANRTTNQSVVLDEIARFAGSAFPPRYQEEYRYLLAKYNFIRARALLEAADRQGEEGKVAYLSEARQSFDQVRELVARIPANSRFHARSRYLDGLSLYVSNRFAPALESFKDVVRRLNPRDVEAIQDPALREQAFMQLARIHFEHGQNRHANFYYEKIARGSEQWLQSLYESSWAHFRLGQYEKALGNLITLRSPFFQDEYFPEALILESVIYYENCRYPEAAQTIEEFERRYAPLHEALEELMARPYTTSQDYAEVLSELRRKGSEGSEGDRMLERILKLALSDKELGHLSDSIVELEEEMDGIAARRDFFRHSSLAKLLVDGLDGQRVELMRRAGSLTQRKLEKERRNLANLRYRALAIKAEIGTREKDALEASLRQGEDVTVVRKYRYSTAVDDEHVYWPYEGEFWRDELGSYEYTLTKGCKER